MSTTMQTRRPRHNGIEPDAEGSDEGQLFPGRVTEFGIGMLDRQYPPELIGASPAEYDNPFDFGADYYRRTYNARRQ